MLEVEYYKDLLYKLYQACIDPAWQHEYWETEQWDDLLEEIAIALGEEASPEKIDA